MDTGDGRSDRLHDDEQSAVTRRRMIGAASMTLAAPGLLGLAACAVPGAQPGAHEQQPVTLQAYMNLSGDRLNGFSAFVAPYIEANPHVTVEAVPYPGSGTAEAVAKLQVLVSGGEPPHIWDGPSSAEQLGTLQMLEVLDTLIKRDKIDLKRYNQKHLEASAMYQGKVWLMPKAYTGNALSMAVNVDLFKQAGVALPSADANRSWTWAEFVETLVKLTRTGPDGEVAQFGLGNFGSVHFTWPLLWDGDWISADLKTATCDSAAMQECYTRFFELPHRYHVLPRPGEATRLFGNANLFTTGKAAVYIVPPWALPQYTQTKTVELTFVPMPRGRRSTPDITLDSLGIPKGVKEVEAAWHFTKWLSEGSRYAKYVGKLPAELSQIEPWVQEQFGIYADPRPQVVTSAIEHGVAQVNLGRHPKFPLLSNLIVPGLNEQVWTQQVAPADFLKAIKPQVQDILDGKAG